MNTNRETAVVTGASTGLGAEFAAQLARRGYDLVLVARSADRLERLAGELTGRYGVSADVIVQDLTERGAAATVAARLAGRPVDLLVNNAGFGTSGRFEDIAGGRDEEQLMVNLVALVGLTRELIPGMLARGRGAVINVSSTAGLQPTPFFTTYGAGKTFVLNFSLALRAEYRGRGITVMALCPGPTRTEFFDTAGERAAIGKKMDADVVVAAALRGLDKGKAYVVPGFGNALNAHLTPRRPRTLVTAIAKFVARGVPEPRTAPVRVSR